MVDPFTYWSRMFTVSMDMAQTALRIGQMLTASRDVIDRRVDLIGVAMIDPINADKTELARMVPEKVAAFSSAGNALVDGWIAWNRAMTAEGQQFAKMAGQGRLPTPLEWMGLASRGQLYGLAAAERSARLGAAVLRPVHAKAVGNADRLRRRAG